MNNIRRSKRVSAKNKLFVDINKDMIKDVILDSYNEIEDQRRKKHTPTEFLKLPLNLIFVSLKVILGFFSIVFFIMPGTIIYNKGWSIANVLSGAVAIFIAVLCGLFALVCHRTDKEVEKETDRYYIVAYFSAIVSLVALIVALIGLIKVI